MVMLLGVILLPISPVGVPQGGVFVAVRLTEANRPTKSMMCRKIDDFINVDFKRLVKVSEYPNVVVFVVSILKEDLTFPDSNVFKSH